MAATTLPAHPAREPKRARRRAPIRCLLSQEPAADATSMPAGAAALRTRAWHPPLLVVTLTLSLLLHAIGVAALHALARTSGRGALRIVPVTLLAAEAGAPAEATGAARSGPAPPQRPAPAAARAPAPVPRRPAAPPARPEPAPHDAPSSMAGTEAPAPPAAEGIDVGAGAPASGHAGGAETEAPVADGGNAPGGAGAAPRRVLGGYQVLPAYPARARRAGLEGTALLRVRVTASGRVGEVRVERSAGDESLDRSASDAVRRWRFEAAPDGASREDVWVLVPIQFRLDDRSS